MKLAEECFYLAEDKESYYQEHCLVSSQVSYAILEFLCLQSLREQGLDLS
jgi:hypothetical protein